MKKILLICTLLVLLTGCTAPRDYKKNRFTKQFQEADSMFNEKYRFYDTYKGNPIYSSMSSIPPSWEPIAWMPKPKFEE